ncbi:hypothetical protein ACNFJ7_05550 [Sphingomonas sp. HT-1]|uniref:hypothetical protein n=1 Tax=unclassified Sphingomonas TaxID=196159 RepID=UPI0002ED606F|nr:MULTISPECIES: hypothetical protein [unclassified Sphingomonas]KTF67519.1 hypothetical protein ATB93_17415 [Sphingomonas sp. WG]
MGHIDMPFLAFRTALSEDSGVRSEFALTVADMLAHLPAESPLRNRLTDDMPMRVGAPGYEDAVGDILFTLGNTAARGMPTRGVRITALLADWRSCSASTS